MVQPIRLYLNVAILVFIAASAAAQTQGSVDILYTSHLLGYYRLPEKQNGQLRPSPGDHAPWCFDARTQPLDMSDESRKLAGTLRSDSYLDPKNRILVGTGDNFALNLPARVFAVEPPLPGRTYEYSKDQFNWDWKKDKDGRPIGWRLASKTSGEENTIISQGFQVIPTDNVACFLAYVGYDAIVPGRHDFYYGSERVRSLARLLASANDEQFHPVQMLAANLLIKTSWISGHPPIPDSQKSKLLFGVADAKNISFPKDGAEILPWLSRIELDPKLDNDDKDKFGVALMGPEMNSDKDSLLNQNDGGDDKVQLQLHGGESCWFFIGKQGKIPGISNNKQCQQKVEAARENDGQTIGGLVCQDQAKTGVRCYLIPAKPLVPGYYKVCMWLNTAGASRPLCSRFTVAAPFFQYPDPDANEKAGELPSAITGTAWQPYKTPKPYLMKLVCPSEDSSHCEKVAIFGVVDPDLAQQVGEINGSWLADKDPDPQIPADTVAIDRRHKVAIKTVDAAKSLKQLMDYWQDCINRNQEDNLNFCYDDTGSRRAAAFKVLLANMTPQKASEIATQLTKQDHFDVIISDHDPEWFTRDEMVIVDPTIVPGLEPGATTDCFKRRDCNVRSFLAVPPPAWDDAWREDPARVLRIIRFQDARLEYLVRGAHAAQTSASKASLESASASLEFAANNFFHERTVDASQKSGGLCLDHLSNSQIACDELQSIAERVLEKTLHSNSNKTNDRSREGGQERTAHSDSSKPDNPTKSNEEELFQQATLATLLKKTHADVGMLQKADFWFGPDRSHRAQCLLEQLSRVDHPGNRPPPTATLCGPDDKHKLQKLLDIIVWKGDTFIVMPVRGSVLQALMKRSKDYDSADNSDLSPENDLGRGLVTMGIEPDGNDYRVNGLALDPNRLYSVVTSDYVASADTDYPEFLDATLPSQPRPFFDKKFEYISSIVCQQYMAYQNGSTVGDKEQNEDKEPDCSSAVTSTEYYDSRNLVDPKPPFGNSWRRQLWLWMPFHHALGQGRPKHSPEKEDPEEWAQDSSIWKLSLDKGSIGFSVQRHSDSQADLNKTFGGVGSSQVLASNAHNWNTDLQVTYLRSYSAVDFVFSPELAYTSAFTEAKQGGFRNPNQPSDTMSLDSGFRIHFLPQKRHSRRWSLDPGIHFETQPFALIQSLSVPSSSLPLQFSLPRTNTRLARLGLGRYDRKSYFQVGLEGGGQFGAFKEFDFPGTPITCVPLATQSLQQCVNAKGDGLLTPTSPVKVLQEFRYRSGVFWHSLLVTPVGPRLSASLENQGEFFFNNAGDNSTDTRLQHTVTAKISFPIWPMISVSPTYQFFYYENKLAYKSLWQQQALITLDYRFDWTNERISRSQLKYKNPQAPQK